MLNVILKFPIGVGRLASASVRIEDPKAPKVSLEAVGRQPPMWGKPHCRYFHRIMVVRPPVYRIKCWALFHGDLGSSCRLVAFLLLP